jgi:hypothetical protein
MRDHEGQHRVLRWSHVLPWQVARLRAGRGTATVASRLARARAVVLDETYGHPFYEVDGEPSTTLTTIDDSRPAWTL